MAVVELDDEATRMARSWRGCRDPSFRDPTAGCARVDDRYLGVNAGGEPPARPYTVSSVPVAS